MIPSEAKILHDQISESNYKLNKWEREFMESIADLIKHDRILSDKRSSALQQLYRRSQGG